MRRWLFAAVVLMFIPVAAYADTMSWTFTSYDSNMHFVIPGGIDVNTQLGIFHLEINDEAPPTNWPNGGTFDAFCVDVQHYVGNGEVVLEDMANWRQPYTDPKSFPAYDGAGSYVAYMIEHFGMPGDLMRKSAMQLAVWEVLYEKPDTGAAKPVFNVSSGFARSYGVDDAELISQANAYVSAVNALTSIPNAHAPWIKTVNDNGSYYQDFTTPVPEPSTLILLGMGLLGAAGLARKKTR